ncbi:hypothetical protein F5880DRAFT_1283455 [Lentinula raphanica]|nr:hypothetical protein F5880DRAFT_1283455 [Lentinula raphanica]
MLAGLFLTVSLSQAERYEYSYESVACHSSVDLFNLRYGGPQAVSTGQKLHLGSLFAPFHAPGLGTYHAIGSVLASSNPSKPSLLSLSSSYQKGGTAFSQSWTELHYLPCRYSRTKTSPWRCIHMCLHTNSYNGTAATGSSVQNRESHFHGSAASVLAWHALNNKARHGET